MKVYIVETDNGEDWGDNYRTLDSVFLIKESAENHLIKKGFGFKRSVNYSNWTKSVKEYGTSKTLVGRITELELHK